MIGDLFVGADGDVVPGPWDLGDVAFSDEPEELVLARAGKVLVARGYLETRVGDAPVYRRGTDWGSQHGPRARNVLTLAAVELVQPGVYEVYFTIRIGEHLLSPAERSLRRDEQEAVMRAIEGRSPISPAWFEHVEKQADVATKGGADEYNALHVSLPLFGLGTLLGIAGAAMLGAGLVVLALCVSGGIRAIRHFRNTQRERREAVSVPDPPPKDLFTTLADSISAIGYWRSWSADTAGRFDVFFSHTELWAPRRATGYRPPGPLGLRFEEPSFVAFFTEVDPPGPLVQPLPGPPPTWPEDLAAGRRPGMPLNTPGMAFNDRPALERALAARSVRPLIGAAPPPATPDEATLVFGTGRVGLAVVARRMSIHTPLGEITPLGAYVLRRRWTQHWFTYWSDRLAEDEARYEPWLELEIPLHPEMNQAGILRTTFAGPPRW